MTEDSTKLTSHARARSGERCRRAARYAAVNAPGLAYTKRTERHDRTAELVRPLVLEIQSSEPIEDWLDVGSGLWNVGDEFAVPARSRDPGVDPAVIPRVDPDWAHTLDPLRDGNPCVVSCFHALQCGMPDDIQASIRAMANLATRAIIISVPTTPSGWKLPETIQSEEWWKVQLEAAAPGLSWAGIGYVDGPKDGPLWYARTDGAPSIPGGVTNDDG